mgnify:FL=1
MRIDKTIMEYLLNRDGWPNSMLNSYKHVGTNLTLHLILIGVHACTIEPVHHTPYAMIYQNIRSKLHLGKQAGVLAVGVGALFDFKQGSQVTLG